MRRLLTLLLFIPFAAFGQQIKPISGVPHEVRTAGNITFITQQGYHGPERIMPVSGQAVIYRGEATIADVIASGVAGGSLVAQDSTERKAGIIIRVGMIESLAELLHDKGESVSMMMTNAGAETKNSETHQAYQAIDNYGMDVGPWTNTGSMSAFIVNPWTTDNQQYYQDQDDLEPDSTKGILTFIEYGGNNYCLQTVVYPGDPANPGGEDGTDYEELNFSTISGGSLITISPTLSGEPAIYLDSEAGYATAFPDSALDKWWCIENQGDGNYKLAMNSIIPLEDYCGDTIQSSGDYSGDDQVMAINFNRYYPNATGLKYQFQENIRTFSELGLTRPVSMAETESGGYPLWDSVPTLAGILEDLDYVGTTRDPYTGIMWVNMKDYDTIVNYKISASSSYTLSAESTMQDIKERIASYYAKNNFPYIRFSGLVTGGDVLDDLDNWEILIDFCQANGIPILSYKDYYETHHNSEYKNNDIFPRLYNDIAEREDGTPDGFNSLPGGITLETTGGVEYDSGYYFTWQNDTDDTLSISRLGGFEPGDTKISFYAKNDSSAVDYVGIYLVDSNYGSEKYNSREIYIPIIGDDWTKYEQNIGFNYTLGNVDIRVFDWQSSGAVDISGIQFISDPVVLEDDYEPETDSLIARMAAVDAEPPTARKILIDNTIKGLKRAEVEDGVYINLFDRMIALHLQAAHNENAAKLNWVANEYNITTYNSPTFVVDSGWNLNGSSQYLGTGFNPASIPEADRRWLMNSATLMIYLNKNQDDWNYACDIGARPTTDSRSMIGVNYGESDDGVGMFYINKGGYGFVTPDNGLGWYGVSRCNDIQMQGLINESISYNSVVSYYLTNAEFLYGRHSSSYSTNRYSCGVIAEGMTVNEMQKVMEIISDEYLSKLGE